MKYLITCLIAATLVACGSATEPVTPPVTGGGITGTWTGANPAFRITQVRIVLTKLPVSNISGYTGTWTGTLAACTCADSGQVLSGSSTDSVRVQFSSPRATYSVSFTGILRGNDMIGTVRTYDGAYSTPVPYTLHRQ